MAYYVVGNIGFHTMRDSRLGPSPSAVTRWSSLIVIALNFDFLLLYASERDPFASSRAITKASESIFPSDLATIGAGAAGFAVVLFFAMALWPRRRSPNIYPRLAAVLATSACAVTAYIVAAAMHADVVATGFIAFVWVLTGVMLTMSARESPRHETLWLRVPFGVLLSVATLLLLQNVGAALMQSRLASPLVVARWGIAAFAIVVLVGGIAALRLHDFIYSATTAAFLVILPGVGGPDTRAVMTAGLGLCVLSVLAALAVARDPREPRPLWAEYQQQAPSSDLDDYPAGTAKQRKGKRRAARRDRPRRYLLEVDSLMRL